VNLSFILFEIEWVTKYSIYAFHFMGVNNWDEDIRCLLGVAWDPGVDMHTGQPLYGGAYITLDLFYMQFFISV